MTNGIDLIPKEPTKKTEPLPPYCPIHFALMEKYKTTKSNRYYRCKAPGCQMRDSTARPHHPKIPKEPMLCPKCGCEQRDVVDGEIKSKPGEQVGMELVVSESTEVRLQFKCPVW